MKNKIGPSALDGSRDAKRTTAVVLEVLSGLRSPSEANEDLGISLQRYYAIETRALQGMITALEPRSKGRQRSPEARLNELKREKSQLHQELSRALALVRASRRAIGLPSLSKRRKQDEEVNGKKRKRKPRARARRAIACLRKGEDESAKPATAKPKPTEANSR